MVDVRIRYLRVITRDTIPGVEITKSKKSKCLRSNAKFRLKDRYLSRNGNFGLSWISKGVMCFYAHSFPFRVTKKAPEWMQLCMYVCAVHESI